MSDTQVMLSRSQIFNDLLEVEYSWFPTEVMEQTYPLWASTLFIRHFHLWSSGNPLTAEEDSVTAT